MEEQLLLEPLDLKDSSVVGGSFWPLTATAGEYRMRELSGGGAVLQLFF